MYVYINNYLKEEANVVNLALSGRSSKSFLEDVTRTKCS